MAKDRIQVQPLRGPELTQVQAQGVSTLYTPQADKPAETNSLLQLGQSLAQIEPALNRFLDNRMAEVTEADIQEGRAAQLRNKVAFKDAVNKGLIPAGANPWFIQGYHEQEQRLNGDMFDQELRSAWAKSPIKETDSPEGFRAWVQTFTGEYIKNHELEGTPRFSVFADKAQASQENLYAQHVGYRQREIERKVIEGTQQEITNTLDQAWMFADDTAVVQAIELRVKEQIDLGLNGSTANKVTVDAVTQKAMEKLDPDILGYLDKISTGSGKLGNTTYAREERLKVGDAIYREMTSKKLREQTQHEQLIKQTKAKLGQEAVGRALSDPTAPIQDLLVQANAVDPDIVGDVIDMHKKATSFTTDLVEDPKLVDEATRKAIFDDDYGVAEMMSETAGKINPGTAKQLYDDINEKVNDPKALRGGWLGQDLKDIESSVVRALGGAPPTVVAQGENGSVFSITDSKTARTPEIDRAVIEAKSMYYQLFRSTKASSKDLLDLQERMNKAKLIILERYAKQTTAAEATTKQASADKELQEFARKIKESVKK